MKLAHIRLSIIVSNNQEEHYVYVYLCKVNSFILKLKTLQNAVLYTNPFKNLILETF